MKAWRCMIKTNFLSNNCHILILIFVYLLLHVTAIGLYLLFDNILVIYFNKCEGGCLKKVLPANTHSHL